MARYRALVAIRHSGGLTEAGETTSLTPRDATWLLAARKVVLHQPTTRKASSKAPPAAKAPPQKKKEESDG